MENNLKLRSAADMAEVDRERMEVTFSCASAAPYERCDWDGTRYVERLVISPDAINVERLNGGASILRNHEPDHVLGKVIRAWIADGKLMVRARFRRNDKEAVAVFNDAVEGTVPNVSVGYSQDEVAESMEDGVLYRDVTRWTVFEVSVAVGIPADATVGFYRSMQIEGDKPMEEEEKKECGCAPENKACGDPEAEAVKEDTPAEEVAEAKEELAEAEAEAAAAEEAEATEEEKEEAMPNGAVEKPEAVPVNEGEAEGEAKPEEEKACGCGEEEKRAAAVKLLTRGADALPVENKVKSFSIPKFNKEDKMADRYSLGRAFQFLLNPGVNADVERSASDELYRAAGMAPARRSLMLRTTFDGGEGVGKGLIGTDHRGDMFVKSLRTRMGVKGARVMSGLVGNVDIPVQTGKVTVGVKALNASAAQTNPTVGSLTLTPKKITAYTTVGEDLLAQGNPDAVAFVVDDLSAQIARALDLAILKGNVDPAIAGLEGTSGVQTVTVANLDAATWSDILKFGGKIADYEVGADVAWITKGSTVQTFKGISKDSGSGRFLLEDGKMDGYDVNICGGLSAGDLYLGAWSNVIIGQWGGLEVRIDDVTGIKDGSVTIVAKLICDIGITNPNAFVKRVATNS